VDDESRLPLHTVATAVLLMQYNKWFDINISPHCYAFKVFELLPHKRLNLLDFCKFKLNLTYMCGLISTVLKRRSMFSYAKQSLETISV